MKAPTDLIWEIIGDAFKDAIIGDQRRPIEGLWQVLQQTAADTISYTEHLKELRNIFDASAFAPYGTFPGEITDSETSTPITATVLGGHFSGAWIWYLWVDASTLEQIPESGHVRVGNRTVPFSDVTENQLASGGFVIKVGTFSGGQNASTINDELPDLPSYAFEVDPNPSRWEYPEDITDHPRGLGFSMDPVDYDEIRDQEYMSANQDWKAVWDFEITNWSTYSDISFFSYGDIDQYSIGIQETQSGSIRGYWSDGGSDVALKEIGDISKIKDSLQGATEARPAEIEIAIEFDASDATLTGSVFVDGEELRQDNDMSVRPTRRTHRLGFTNEDKDSEAIEGVIRNFIVPYGKLRKPGDPEIPEAEINADFPYTFSIEAPVVESSRIWMEPWDLAPRVDVIEHEDETLEVEKKGEFAGYLPEYGRVQKDDGDFYILKKTDDSTYDVIEKNTADDLEREIEIHPLFMNSDEFEWVGDGEVGVEFDIQGADRIWIEDAKAREVNLYHRYGELLDAREEEDSKEYLSKLRGMHLGIFSSPSPQDTERSIDILLGAPFAPTDGELESVEPIENSAGATEYYEATVGGQKVRVENKFEEHLFPLGMEFEKFDSLVDGTQVVDWYNDDQDILDTFFPPDEDAVWARWGTFIVLIPSYYGINEAILENIFTVLERSKNKNKTFNIEFSSTENIEDQRQREDQHLSEATANKRTDMVFDVMRSVANNPISDAPEDDTGSYPEIDHADLDSSNAMTDELVRVPYTADKMGQVLGGGYSREEKIREDRLTDDLEAIQLMRSLESYENSDFSRARARIGKDSTPHPVSMCYVYDAGTDTLTSYQSKSFDSGATLSEEPYAIDIRSYDDIDIAALEIHESSDYGQSTNKISLAGGKFLDIERYVACGDILAIKRSGTWEVEDNTTNIYSAVAVNGNELIISKYDADLSTWVFLWSDDGGDTFNQNQHLGRFNEAYYSPYYGYYFVCMGGADTDDSQEVKRTGFLSAYDVMQGNNDVTGDKNGRIYSCDENGYIFYTDDPSTSGGTSNQPLSDDITCIDYGGELICGTSTGDVVVDPLGSKDVYSLGTSAVADVAAKPPDYWVAILKNGEIYRWK